LLYENYIWKREKGTKENLYESIIQNVPYERDAKERENHMRELMMSGCLVHIISGCSYIVPSRYTILCLPYYIYPHIVHIINSCCSLSVCPLSVRYCSLWFVCRHLLVCCSLTICPSFAVHTCWLATTTRPETMKTRQREKETKWTQKEKETRESEERERKEKEKSEECREPEKMRNVYL